MRARMHNEQQLNSPTIHFSSSLGVPSGEAKMKSVVHQRGTGSSGRSRAGITSGRSSELGTDRNTASERQKGL